MHADETRPGTGPDTGRFAPSTTGPAHAGTLLAALLCWLDVRRRGGRLLLRLEDLDPERCRPEWAAGVVEALRWLGLDWDAEQRQSAQTAGHAAALDRLEAAGRLYPCACSRSEIRQVARRAPDGSHRYPGTCRERRLPAGGWRACDEPLRVRLPEGRLEIDDEGGFPLSQDPAAEMGDPVVRRRDGSVAYQLAGVVDDAAGGVTRVVRGNDLAASTATQVALQRLLGLARPAYRHHLLLVDETGRKLGKSQDAVGVDALRAHYREAPRLLGTLAAAAGLRDRDEPARASELLADFRWSDVSRRDRVLRVDAGRLALLGWRDPEVY
ncbi:MAG: glutamate--tRNA ligase family protein [Myxococcota bacterium]